MKQSGRRIAAVVLALVLAAAGMAGCRISRTRAMTDKERTACEAYTISFPEEVLGDKTLAETILSLCTAQEETEHGTVYDGVALQPYLYQCREVAGFFQFRPADASERELQNAGRYRGLA